MNQVPNDYDFNQVENPDIYEVLLQPKPLTVDQSITVITHMLPEKYGDILRAYINELRSDFDVMVQEYIKLKNERKEK